MYVEPMPSVSLHKKEMLLVDAQKDTLDFHMLEDVVSKVCSVFSFAFV